MHHILNIYIGNKLALGLYRYNTISSALISILLAFTMNYINRGRVYTMCVRAQKLTIHISYHLFTDATTTLLYSFVCIRFYVCVFVLHMNQIQKTQHKMYIMVASLISVGCFKTGNTRQNHGNMSHSNISLILVLQTNILAKWKI